MAKDRKKVQHIHSSVFDKQPTPATLELGEIGVNNNEKGAFLSVKNSKDEVVRFSEDKTVVDWMEYKEVFPYKGYVRGDGGTDTTIDGAEADTYGSYGITEEDLLTNKSNIVFKMNQVAAQNSNRYNEINSNKDMYDHDISVMSEDGNDNGAGFFVDMSRYAMMGSNPEFSSVTTTCHATFYGTTEIIGADRDGDEIGGEFGDNDHCGSLLDIQVATAQTDVDVAETSAKTATTLIGENDLTISGNTTERVSGTTTITRDGNVKETNLHDRELYVSGSTTADTAGNVLVTTSGTTTIDREGDVSENNQSDVTIVTSGDTTHTISGNSVTNVSGNTTADTGGNVTVTTSGTTTIDREGNVSENNQKNVTIVTSGNTTETISGNSITNVSGSTTADTGGNVTVTTSGNTTETIKGNESHYVSGNTTADTIGNVLVTTSGTTTIDREGDVSENNQSNVTIITSGNTTHTISGNSTTNVSGVTTVDLGNDVNVTISGNTTVDQEGDLDINNQSNVTITTSGNTTHTISGNSVTNISGTSTTNISGDTTLNVSADTLTNVSGNVETNTALNETHNISGSSETNIKKNETKNVTGNVLTNTTGTTTENKIGDVTENTTGTTTIDRIGDVSVNNHNNVTIVTSGNTTETISGNSVTNVSGTSTTNISGDTTLNVSADTHTNVTGKTYTNVTGGSETVVLGDGTSVTSCTKYELYSDHIVLSACTKDGDIGMYTKDMCLSASNTTTLYGVNKTNVGLSCDNATPSVETNISGVTLNTSATTANTKIVVDNTIIGTEDRTVSGTSTTRISGTSTNTVGGNVTNVYESNVTETTHGNEVKNVSGSTTADTAGNVVVTTSGTTTETKKGDVTETNQANYTQNTTGDVLTNTTGTTTENKIGNVTENTTGTTTIVRDGNVKETDLHNRELYVSGSTTADTAGNVTVLTSGTTTETKKGNVVETNQSNYTQHTTGNVLTNTTGTTTENKIGNVTENTTGTTTIVRDGDVTETNLNDRELNVSGTSTTNIGTNEVKNVSGTSDTVITGATTVRHKNTYTENNESDVTVSTTGNVLTNTTGTTTENKVGNVTENTTGTTTINNYSKTTINVTGGTEITSCDSIEMKSKNITITDAGCPTGQVTIETDDLCMIGETKVNVYGNTTNVGIDCDGGGVAATTNMKGATTNISGSTTNVSGASTLNMSGQTTNISGSSINVIGGDVNVFGSGSVCLTGNSLTVAASGGLHIGAAGCGGGHGTYPITYERNPDSDSCGIKATTVDDALREVFTRSKLHINRTDYPADHEMLYNIELIQDPDGCKTSVNFDVPKDHLLRDVKLQNDSGNWNLHFWFNVFDPKTGHGDDKEIVLDVQELVTDLDAVDTPALDLDIWYDGASGNKKISGDCTVQIAHPNGTSVFAKNASVHSTTAYGIEFSEGRFSSNNYDPFGSDLGINVPTDINHIDTRTVSWSGFSSGSYNGKTDASFSIPTAVSQLTRGSLSLTHCGGSYTFDPASDGTMNLTHGTLSFNSGAFGGGSFDACSNASVNVPTALSHLTYGKLSLSHCGGTSEYDPAAGGSISLSHGTLTVTSGGTSIGTYNACGDETIDLPKVHTLTLGSGKFAGGTFDPNSADVEFKVPSSLTELSEYNGSCLSTPDLCVGGSVSAGAFYQGSDMKLKENIVGITSDEIDKINTVNFKSFNFKDDETKTKVYGVIAQDVQNAGLDNLVHTSESGTLSVDYTSMLILKMASMERTINRLMDEINNLKSASVK